MVDSTLTIQTETTSIECDAIFIPPAAENVQIVNTCYRVGPIHNTLEGSNATQSLIDKFLSEIFDAVKMTIHSQKV